MAESLGHDPNTLSGTHCLAGRPGNRTGCALLAEGGGIEPLTLRSPWFSGPVASHLAAPSRNGTPGIDSNSQHLGPKPSASAIGLRGHELVRATGIEPACSRRPILSRLRLPFSPRPQ